MDYSSNRFDCLLGIEDAYTKRIISPERGTVTDGAVFPHLTPPCPALCFFQPEIKYGSKESIWWIELLFTKQFATRVSWAAKTGAPKNGSGGITLYVFFLYEEQRGNHPFRYLVLLHYVSGIDGSTKSVNSHLQSKKHWFGTQPVTPCHDITAPACGWQVCDFQTQRKKKMIGPQANDVTH